MGKNYDLIATVDIDIANPIVDDASFDNLLILGPKPSSASATAPKVGVYSSLQEVIDSGFSVSESNPDPVGIAAMVAFSQTPRPTQVYIATQQEDEDSDTGLEDITETIKRALEMSGWYVLCTAGIPETKYPAIAAFIETQEKMFAYTETACFEANGSVDPVVPNTYFRTFGVTGNTEAFQAVSDIPEGNKYINVASVAKWLHYDSGSETFAFKQLAAIEPSVFTSTQMKLLAEAPLNYFITVGNRKITMNGLTRGGEWIDIIRFRDWLKNDMQVRVVNLFITNPKIPYTDDGISLVENQMRKSLKAGQDAGGIAPTEYDEDKNPIPGYVTSVPIAANLTASEKASRKLHNCKFKARLAGAIHFAEISGSLTYEL